MAVSPCTALCSADARAATSSTSTGSLRSATNAQRLSFAGTLVRVLEPPVKDGVNQVRMLYGFMSWSTGHGLVTMLELHSLSVIPGEYRGRAGYPDAGDCCARSWGRTAVSRARFWEALG